MPKRTRAPLLDGWSAGAKAMKLNTNHFRLGSALTMFGVHLRQLELVIIEQF